MFLTFKGFYTSRLKKKPRVNGVEQLTLDCVCRQCRVLSLTDWTVVGQRAVQPKCLCFCIFKFS